MQKRPQGFDKNKLFKNKLEYVAVYGRTSMGS